MSGFPRSPAALLREENERRLVAENQRLAAAAHNFELLLVASTDIQVSSTALAALIVERDHLRRQVTELQEQLTARVEQRRQQRLEELDSQVTEFHQKFGFPVRKVPTQPTDAEIRFRLKLICEEFFEVIDSCSASTGRASQLAQTFRVWLNEIAILQVDLPNLAKELADLDYVVEGTRQTFGIPRAPVAKAVHESNMDKEPGNPKPVKPEGWKAPDIAGILEKARAR